MGKLKVIKEKFTDNDYEFVGEGIQSGEGIVFKAIKEQKEFAIKIINNHSGSRTDRYEQEIKNVEKLDHPNVIKAQYGNFEFDGETVHYSIMPFYQNDLRKIIPELLDYKEIIKLLINLGEALKYIHNIDINWDRTVEYPAHINESPLLNREDDYVQKYEIKIKQICEILRDRWGASYDYIGENIRFVFENKEKYDEFKVFALKLAKPHYVFEGDVLDIFHKEKVISTNEVILDLNKSFDVEITLAKILGLKRIR